MGKITQEERVVLSILLHSLFLWIVPSLLRSVYRNNNDDDELAIDRSAGVFSGIINIFIKNVKEKMTGLLLIFYVELV